MEQYIAIVDHFEFVIHKAIAVYQTKDALSNMLSIFLTGWSPTCKDYIDKLL
jgi:hypothetical protein